MSGFLILPVTCNWAHDAANIECLCDMTMDKWGGCVTWLFFFTIKWCCEFKRARGHIEIFLCRNSNFRCWKNDMSHSPLIYPENKFGLYYVSVLLLHRKNNRYYEKWFLLCAYSYIKQISSALLILQGSCLSESYSPRDHARTYYKWFTHAPFFLNPCAEFSELSAMALNSCTMFFNIVQM